MTWKNKPNINRLYEQLIERFAKWAETCSDIRAAIIVGSRARLDHPADKWADLDVILITTDPERYLSTSDWIENIGNPLLTFLEPTAAGGEIERRVLFEGMLDVDFAIFPKRKIDQIGQLLQDEVPVKVATLIMNTFGRGMRVLVDKDGVLAQLRTIISSIEAQLPRARAWEPSAFGSCLKECNDGGGMFRKRKELFSRSFLSIH